MSSSKVVKYINIRQLDTSAFAVGEGRIGVRVGAHQALSVEQFFKAALSAAMKYTWVAETHCPHCVIHHATANFLMARQHPHDNETEMVMLEAAVAICGMGVVLTGKIPEPTDDGELHLDMSVLPIPPCTNS